MTSWKSDSGQYNLQILSVFVGIFMKAELKKTPKPTLSITICMRKHDRCIVFMISEAHISSNLFLLT